MCGSNRKKPSPEEPGKARPSIGAGVVLGERGLCLPALFVDVIEGVRLAAAVTEYQVASEGD
jgi:hypothetical protein